MYNQQITMRFIDPFPFGPTSTDRLHLLQLPAELREHIYEYTILSEDRTLVSSDGTDRQPIPPLLQICSQIRTEALKLYFSESTFAIALEDLSTAAFKKWYRDVASDHAHLITKLTLFIPIEYIQTLDLGSPFLCRTLLKGLFGQHAIPPENMEVTFKLTEDYVYKFNEQYLDRSGNWKLSREQLLDMADKVRQAEKLVNNTLPQMYERIKQDSQGRSRSM